MSVLSRDTKKRVEVELKELKRAVPIEVFTQEFESPACKESRLLAEELAEITMKVSVNVSDFVGSGSLVRKHEVERIPTIVLASRDSAQIRFAGSISGYILPSFISALKTASTDKTVLAEASISFLENLQKDIYLKVFVVSSCPLCQTICLPVIRLALANRLIHAEIINLEQYPQLAVRYGVSGVPLVLVNNEHKIEGALSEAAFVEKLSKTLQ